MTFSCTGLSFIYSLICAPPYPSLPAKTRKRSFSFLLIFAKLLIKLKRFFRFSIFPTNKIYFSGRLYFSRKPLFLSSGLKRPVSTPCYTTEIFSGLTEKYFTSSFFVNSETVMILSDLCSVFNNFGYCFFLNLSDV